MTTKTKVGLMAGAHPTAPGGMSQQALADELVEKHGWDLPRVQQFRAGKQWDRNQWVAMIDAVCQARLDAGDGKDPGMDADFGVATEADELDEFFDSDEFDPADLGEPEQVDLGMPLLWSDPNTKDYIFNGHTGTGPSSAARWMTCTASLGASRAFLETLTANQQGEFAEANAAARQGTTAHAAAEIEAHVLLGEIDREEADLALMELAITPDSEGESYDEEMAEYIEEYTDLIKSYVDEGRDVMIEARLSAIIPLMTVDAEGNDNLYELRGSGDCVVMPSADDPTLVVGDLKYGNGHDVAVEKNPQVRIYALGALDGLADENGELICDVEEVEYIIAQPRLGGIKVWRESVDALLAWRDDVLSPALTQALGGKKEGANFVPSDEACQWCPNRGRCPALIEQKFDAAQELFTAVLEEEFAGNGDIDAAALDNETLGSYFMQIKGLMKLHESIRDEAQRRLYRGEDVPGLQLVNYSPPRQWVEGAEEEFDPDLLDHLDPNCLTPEQTAAMWKRTLLSPTQAVKMLGKKDAEKIEALIHKPDIRPVVAPVGDRRKTWEGKPPEAMFDIEPEEE